MPKNIGIRPTRSHGPAEQLIDEALASYPLASLPDDFRAQVMGRIQAAPRIRLQFSFLDLALPAAAAIFSLVVICLFLWLMGALNTSWLPEPAHTLSLPTLPSFTSSIWLLLGIVVMAIEAILVVIAVTGFSLWSDT